MIWPFNGGKKRGRHEEVIIDGLRSDGIPVDVMTDDDVRRQTFRSKNSGRYYLAKDVDQFMDRVGKSIKWYRDHAGQNMIKSAGSELVDDKPVIMNEALSDGGSYPAVDDSPKPDELPVPDIDEDYADRFKPNEPDSGTIPVPPAVDEPEQSDPINPFTGLPAK